MSHWDVLAAVGVLVIAVGVGLIYIPAGIITAGIGISGLGLIGSIIESRKANAPGAERAAEDKR